MDKRNKRIRIRKPNPNKRIHRQDCICIRCIENNNSLIQEIPEEDHPFRPKRNEIYDINIKLKKEELNQKPIYRDFFYNDIIEEWDDYLRILKTKDLQLKELTKDIKNLQDWVKDHQQIKDMKKDINKLKNDMKELLDFNNTIIQNEVDEQAKQIQKIKQREQTKKFKED